MNSAAAPLFSLNAQVTLFPKRISKQAKNTHLLFLGFRFFEAMFQKVSDEVIEEVDELSII